MLSRKQKKSRKPAAGKSASRGGRPAAALDFNHAMIYARDLDRSARFYVNLLGFKPIDEFRHDGRLIYLRIRAPLGNGTIALHMLEPGKSISRDEGVRLYFEVENLEEFCGKLQSQGFLFDKPPKMMPWGWMHAYMSDPDGHEISLYWAGAKRMKKITMLNANTRTARKG